MKRPRKRVFAFLLTHDKLTTVWVRYRARTRRLAKKHCVEDYPRSEGYVIRGHKRGFR